MAPEVKFDRRALCSHGAVQCFRSVHTERTNEQGLIQLPWLKILK